MDRDELTIANVIKRPAEVAGHRGVIKNQTIAAKREAEDIVARASLEAEAIVRNAASEAEMVREEAYRDGRERSLTEFARQLIEIRESRSNVLRDAERDLLTLSVRIAEKILGNELTSDKKAINGIVSTALTNARHQERVTVFVNPSDIETVTEERGKFSPDGRVRILDFVADPSVPAGGCVIETEVGKIDARIETQLKVIEEALLGQADGEESI